MIKDLNDYYITTAEELANNLRSMREDRALTQQTIADELIIKVINIYPIFLL